MFKTKKSILANPMMLWNLKVLVKLPENFSHLFTIQDEIFFILIAITTLSDRKFLLSLLQK